MASEQALVWGMQRGDSNGDGGASRFWETSGQGRHTRRVLQHQLL
ncbi:hypothetical protein PC123_g1532 [Phytophthora cactorum]|nr:hypothetical protein PC123_g1532 [Phytophthora cactorum]